MEWKIGVCMDRWSVCGFAMSHKAAKARQALSFVRSASWRMAAMQAMPKDHLKHTGSLAWRVNYVGFDG